MKAMILAAGFGTRLLPATKTLPKPCFPILNKPMIVYIIERLRAVGVSEIVVNLHHLPEIIKATLKEWCVDGVTIHFSYEENILGTAGGIKKVQDILDGDTFILYNGDIFSEVDLTSAVRFHKENASKATMIVKEGDHPAFIGLNDDFRITRFPYGALKSSDDYTKRTYFTGIHIFEPTVFDYIPEVKFSGINSDVYPKMLSDGHLAYGYVTDTYFIDIGTPADYLRLNSYLLKGKEYVTGLDTKISDGSMIKNAVIGHRCTIERGAKIIDSVILNDVVIKESAVIKNSVILNGCVVPAGGIVENTILTR